MLNIFLLFPVHEFGHYIVAIKYEVLIHDYQLFPTLIRWAPFVHVDEFTFPTLTSLIVYYMMGFLLPTVIAWAYQEISGSTSKRSSSYIWVTLAPVIAITDFDNLLRLFWLQDIGKWLHLGLGMFLMFRIQRIVSDTKEVQKN